MRVSTPEEVLVSLFRADRSVITLMLGDEQQVIVSVLSDTEGSEPVCRCYRCGALLRVQDVRIDRSLERLGLGMRPVCDRCTFPQVTEL